jgi:putative ATPase
MKALIQRALTDKERGLGNAKLSLDEHSIERMILAADGDARRLLNILEIVAQKNATVEEVLQQDYRAFDNQGDIFYEQISALHKSVRGSSPDGALYWLCRMLDGGCSPTYIARRVVRMASEDIGNAEPRALGMAVAAWEAYERLGSPEGELALAQIVVYLACAPKSNATYVAYNEVMADIRRSPSYPVPMHLRNAPTALMKNMEYGKGYRYAHDEPEAISKGQTYFPPEIGEKQYYFPVERGLEAKIAEKLKILREKH